jgi:hypothetical protein
VKRSRVALFALCIGCYSEPPDQRASAAAATAPSQPPGEFVVFSRERLVISQLGVAVPAPVTVGSSPSEATLASEAPDVVVVTAAGELVGRRNGTAKVRNLTKAGGFLEVEVRGASALVLHPEVLVLPPGTAGAFRLVAVNDDHEIAGEHAEWSTASPDVAVPRAGRIEAGAQEGSTLVTAQYGGQSARALVLVRRPRK